MGASLVPTPPGTHTHTHTHSFHSLSLSPPPFLQPSSIHWHGQRQVATSIMDGVVSVTQRLVGGADGATNASTTPPAFLYDFYLREGENENGEKREKRQRAVTKERAGLERARVTGGHLLNLLSLSLHSFHSGGAYWYHSHASVQYMDGLRGMLYVDDPAFSLSAGPVHDEPTLLFLTDWYHQLADDLAEDYLTNNPDGAEPVPDNALANGIGQHYCGEACEVAILDAAPPADDDGEPGELCSSPTDFILVNGAGFAPFYVSLLTTGPLVRYFIVALDGVPTAPEDMTGLPVFIDAGQRVRLSLCREGGASAAASPVFVLAEMADANFDSVSPFNSTVALLDFSGRKGGFEGLVNVKEEMEAVAAVGGALPWKAGASTVKVSALLAVPGLVPARVVAAFNAPINPDSGPALAAGDAKKAAVPASRKAAAGVKTPAAMAAAQKSHHHSLDREETDPARITAREAMRSSTALRPRE